MTGPTYVQEINRLDRAALERPILDFIEAQAAASGRAGPPEPVGLGPAQVASSSSGLAPRICSTERTSLSIANGLRM